MDYIPWYGLIPLAGIAVFGLTETVRMVLKSKRAPAVAASRELQQSLDANRALQRRLDSMERKLFDLELENTGRPAPPLKNP
ncbi:hypothetical protein QNO08_09005 [Arthrobacter sp. zg-Y820]|uniref:hypothetical protein n=1 Tax=unclassified Arthrobacter TaxID=235627 RepID=UPI001E560F35|nr:MULTISPECIES: hypothetical protein [unclassified Arthrobacter]MCC9196745.1 hypothetical protein [Arthrobacter sp. zg-Y820]MDK1279607.1 hypothetical protein [Arthrobacter sp. zg.Y820]WIB08022.1 hypothetical protein QNO08_09005 [Arthrobacter sp. zg-Y820]